MANDTYYDLFRSFIDGAQHGTHRKIEIVERSDRTLLVGFKHSVYAERMKDSGAITIYTGWGERATKASEIHVAKLQKAMDRFRDWSDAMELDSREDRLPTLQNGDLGSFAVDMEPVGAEAEPRVSADAGEESSSSSLAELFGD